MPSCPWNLPRDRPQRAGDGPVPWPGSLPGPWFLARVLPEARCQGWPNAISEGNGCALDIEGKHVTIQGPSPDLTSSMASGLLGGPGHVRLASLRYLRCCPEVAVLITLS